MSNDGFIEEGGFEDSALSLLAQIKFATQQLQDALSKQKPIVSERVHVVDNKVNLQPVLDAVERLDKPREFVFTFERDSGGKIMSPIHVKEV